ncbi:amidohydrolase family protein [Nakamurella flava]|uniref:Amidohydrolase family protein n=2 Tax=Nakamurella flava TaxID=2576308 RepID=A0A4U6QNT7_9ACTN|nr:amidohydrolase family protein [Nakamurella flava]
MVSVPNLHVSGVDAATGEPVELWAAAGVFVDGPVADPITLTGWVLPGLVDAHCHVGYSTEGPVELGVAEDQARTALASGALALRDCGSPTDTRPLVGRDDLPVLVRAGRHIARSKRYIRGLGVEVDTGADLVAEVRRQAAYGGGWVKIVGDWIDRGIGDLAPIWPDDVLVEAIAAAHDAGARVTAHVFGEDALPGLLAAGIDCIEHGTGLTEDTVATMADQGVHLVPTMINIENFPSFADAAGRFPLYAAHIRDLHARSDATLRAAAEAGVVIHAGTDAGGYIAHGRLVDEMVALGRVMSARSALAAGSHTARAFLGLRSYQPGDPADLVVYDDDPGLDLAALRAPRAVVRAGVIRAGFAAADATGHAQSHDHGYGPHGH